MKLVVGLGNWGPEFNGTRHNIGFDTLDDFIKPYSFNEDTKSFHHTYPINGHECMFVKPITGMNVCGPVVRELVEMFDLSVEDIIVVYDDMDFEPGQIKIKKGGGDGKHNGVKSIINHIGSDFIRVRVGIGKPKTKEQGIDFVLEPFTSPERKLIDSAIEKAVGAVNIIIKEGVSPAMVFFNRKNND